MSNGWEAVQNLGKRKGEKLGQEFACLTKTVQISERPFRWRCRGIHNFSFVFCDRWNHNRQENDHPSVVGYRCLEEVSFAFFGQNTEND